jgi:hypothetical protein
METEEQLRALAKRRVEGRRALIMHTVMYVVVNTALVAIWAMTGSHYPWFIWPMFGWGIGIAGHALALWFGPDSMRSERAIDREVQRLHAHH